jgi:hypothetical protein
MRGVWQTVEFKDGLPSGSKVFTNPKASHPTAHVSLSGLKKIFLPRKCLSKTFFFIFDSRSEHQNNLDTLKHAETNGSVVVIIENTNPSQESTVVIPSISYKKGQGDRMPLTPSNASILAQFPKFLLQRRKGSSRLNSFLTNATL